MQQSQILLWLERSCAFIGVILLSLFIASRLHATVAGQADIEAFEQSLTQFQPDTSLWSDSAKNKYQKTLQQANEEVMALLEIDAVDIKVPVYFDTSELNLNRGAGLVAGAGANNLAIAAHRDSYFRGLADIETNDTIRVRNSDGVSEIYQVNKVLIVEPDDTRLLRTAEQPELTLITCYPFYFVGSAPQRYIVKASLIDDPNAL
ncbi:class D sortase [Neiella marina]|uniref:Class D sortase n=1 Tax=Neiella holothuriorum TaxID=2870530 RepID=A0ABS7EDQ4_9GAMM|nr:class D sortase [Neiella holothuriorum]MBW8190459.1 class D sortase [Neiella holothuriorum]